VKKSILSVCIVVSTAVLVGCSSDTPKTTEINSLPVESVETTTTSSEPATSSVAGDSWADVVERVRPAVVRIEVQTCGNDEGVGSGFAIDGWIVTNRHVVEGYRNLVVVNASGNKRLPDEVRVSNNLDLALIKVPSAVSMSWATTSPRVADDVAALGFPRGMGFSFTKGSLSALDVRVDDGDLSISGLLQTDAAVNPGNSGGPLIDKSGNVLGVVVLKRNDSEGLAFAIDGRQAQVFMSGEKGQLLEPCSGGATPSTEGTVNPVNPVNPTAPDGTQVNPTVADPTVADPTVAGPTAADTIPESASSLTPDDASAVNNPEQVVLDFYAAVEAGAYDVAWALGGRNLGKNATLKDFAAGYKNTESSSARIIEVNGNFVTVEVKAVEITKNGARQISTYVGNYEVIDNEIVSGKFKLTNRE
jgi:S1-C subfamily serine protease